MLFTGDCLIGRQAAERGLAAECAPAEQGFNEAVRQRDPPFGDDGLKDFKGIDGVN